MCDNRPKHTRPFSLADVKAGAPVSLACGWPVQIIKYDMRDGKCPILGLYGDQDQIGRWTADGTFLGGGHSSLHLVMVPVGYLDGKPVFFGDTLWRDGNFGLKLSTMVTSMPFDFDGWRWPEPEKVYPVTGMEGETLINEYYDFAGNEADSSVHIANVAIRHFIDNLGVMPDNCALRAKLKELGWTEPDERPF